MWRPVLFLGGAFLAVAALTLATVLGTAGLAGLFGAGPEAKAIAPGFVGVANFGEWRLICVPGPVQLDSLSTTSAPDPAVPAKTHANACRINQEMMAPQQNPRTGEKPGQVIVATNLSLIGLKQTPAAMLRLPVTARPGDMVGFRFDDGAMAQTKVRDCAATECLAAWTLSGSDWRHLSAARSLQVIFPATGRQWCCSIFLYKDFPRPWPP
ncbi:MAG TPA: hypothetical protein VGM72_02440 [Micropepsaceae bacterium]